MTTRSEVALIKELEDFLSSKYRTLSASRKEELLGLYKKYRKQESLLIICWFFSFHYVYVGRWKMFFLFFFSLGGLFIWWVIDLFRLDTILKQYNKKKAEELFEKLEKA
ncbi:MAG: hypothetical protein PQ612_04730 [Rickettsiales bacterium]|nr:hypothetical protein [Pseudomonadota bacterium]MDA0966326.1 hypothetical protein [Pseudomonadota bacterium]MDG4543958.1 hypothetical protein [Rickettsiales bacterium]MDG4545452.1 hypothetical protein [Rickettsiales bacterium]MDG4547901.1 hypothetical protein [Rickettsiales bacterium]